MSFDITAENIFAYNYPSREEAVDVCEPGNCKTKTKNIRLGVMRDGCIGLPIDEDCVKKVTKYMDNYSRNVKCWPSGALPAPGVKNTFICGPTSKPNIFLENDLHIEDTLYNDYYRYPYNNHGKYTEYKLIRFRDILYNEKFPINQINFYKKRL